jgi:hypothetical protein
VFGPASLQQYAPGAAQPTDTLGRGKPRRSGRTSREICALRWTAVIAYNGSLEMSGGNTQTLIKHSLATGELRLDRCQRCYQCGDLE